MLILIILAVLILFAIFEIRFDYVEESKMLLMYYKKGNTRDYIIFWK